MILLLPLLLAADPIYMIPVSGEGARYWSRWRGPSGQGLVADSGYPDRWSDTENVLWKSPVPGRGNSSPIVWKDYVFLTTAVDGPKRLLLAFDRMSGKLRWEAAAPEAPGERLYWKNTYASSTPLTDGERIYTYFGNAGVTAFDLQGKQVWHESFGTITLYHRSAGSPLLYKDRLILFQDQRANSFVTALDAKTGKRLWTTPRQERVGWGTPIAVRVKDHDEILISSEDRVTSHDPDTGKLLWWVNGNTFETTPTPVVGHGLVFAASGRAGPTLAIRPGGTGDLTQSNIAWQTPRGSPFIPSPLLYGDYLYTVNDMASIGTVFEAKTGKTVWQGRMREAAKEGFSASPAGVNNKVFFTNDQGETYVLKVAPDVEILHVNRFNERVLASPALVEQRWYWRTEKHLYAIGKR